MYWKYYYSERLEAAITFAEENAITSIDCEISYTTTCQTVRDYWASAIDALFEGAWEEAHRDMDDPDTPVDEAEVSAYLASSTIERPVSDALPDGCTN